MQHQDDFVKASENSPYNKYIDGPNKKLGIIACGIGYNYLMENYPKLRISGIENRPVPASQETTDAACRSLRRNTRTGRRTTVCRKTTERLPRHRRKVKGRLDGTLSQDGELNPDSVARAVGKENKAEFAVPSLVEMRPPALCEGCGHRDMYTVLTEVLRQNTPATRYSATSAATP